LIPDVTYVYSIVRIRIVNPINRYTMKTSQAHYPLGINILFFSIILVCQKNTI